MRVLIEVYQGMAKNSTVIDRIPQIALLFGLFVGILGYF
jgi:hypothetical protein